MAKLWQMSEFASVFCHERERETDRDRQTMLAFYTAVSVITRVGIIITTSIKRGSMIKRFD